MLLRRTYGAPVAAVSMSVEGETAAYAAAVVANGGTVSDARVAILNTFIRAEKFSGAWALTDDYWALWAESEAQGLTSLKQLRLATVVAAPTFTEDAGYAFNGTTQYINTGFLPATHAVAMAATSARIAVYERTNVAAGTYAAGVANTSSRRLAIVPRGASGVNAAGEMNAEIGSFTLPAADSLGFVAVSRAGATAANCAAYKNGSAMTRVVDPSAFGATLPTAALYVGGLNSAGTFATGRASSLGFVCVGAALSAAQEAAQYAAVQAFATAVGAQV